MHSVRQGHLHEMFPEDQQGHRRILFRRSDRQLVDSMEVPLKGCRKASKEMFKKRQCMREGGSKNFVAKFSKKSMNLKLFLRIKNHQLFLAAFSNSILLLHSKILNVKLCSPMEIIIIRN